MRNRLLWLWLCIAMLIYTPAQGGFSIGMNSSLDTLSYDLDNISLKLEHLDARWQLLPAGDGAVVVERLRAKRLLVTLHSDKKNAKDTGLPTQIKLPFPINIQQADIAELVIVTATDRYTLHHVKFGLNADAKMLRFNQLQADTPWGKVNGAFVMSTAQPFALSGAVSFKQDNAETNYDVTAYDVTAYDVTARVSGNLNVLRFESSALLVKQGQKLAILQTQSKHALPVARLVVGGELKLTELKRTDRYPLLLNAHLTEFHPERLGNYPAALLNVDLSLQGQLLADAAFKDASVKVQFATKDSQWQGHALSGSGRMLLAGMQIRSMDIQANMAGNTVKASGSMGAPDSHLEWRTDLPNIAAFGEQFSGTASASGVLDGNLENFALRANILGQKLRLPSDVTVENLVGKVAIMAGSNGKFEGELKAEGLQRQQSALMHGSMALVGTRAAHQLNITLQAQGATLAQAPLLQCALQGGLLAGRWQGQLQSFLYHGAMPVTLQAPASLSVGVGEVSLKHAALQMAKGHADIDSFTLNASGFSSKGHFSQVGVDDLPAGLFTLPPSLQGNPVFSGQWAITADQKLNGNISLKREAGDLTVMNVNGTNTLLGLQQVTAELQLHENQAKFNAHLAGNNLGKFDLDFSTMLVRTASGFSLLASAPLILSSSAELNTLAWLPLPASFTDASVDGQVRLAVQGNGTLIKPNLSGSISGKNLRLTLPSSSVVLTHGQLEANFKQDQLHITQAVWKGGEGYLRTSGLVMLENKQAKVDMDWHADRFTLISGADRLLILSGSGNTKLAHGLLSISGNFTADQGLVELASETTPRLGDDVVVLGRNEVVAEPALKILLNKLHLDLGDQFILRGTGLDAELSGAMTLSGLTQYSPHAEGNIKVKKGTYMLYGQILHVERGSLNFNGPLGNPSLNIRAMRNRLPINLAAGEAAVQPISTDYAASSAGLSSAEIVSVNAGVEITGTGFQPVIKLVSEPNVPETEKISWLMLGHGLGQAGKGDFALLSLAAGALLTPGQSLPLQTRLARAVGLDELSFSGADADTVSLTVGKLISTKLYLSYEKSMSSLLNVARLTFNITPRWSIRAEAGAESAVDTLYIFRFQ